MLLHFMQWLQSIGFFTDIRESGLEFPIILTTHLSGMALFGGAILLSDVRLLGWALTKYSLTDVLGGLRWYKRVGGVITMTCGALLASSEAEKYYYNPFFWAKMCFLASIALHAIYFRPRVYNNTEALDKAAAIPGVAKIAGGLSLVLWLGMVTFGRLIGYYEGGPIK